MEMTDLAMAGSGWLALIGKMVWEKFFSSEGKASETLVNSLNERLAAQEADLDKLENQLDNERNLRRLAEDTILSLQLELKRHNIEIPKHS